MVYSSIVVFKARFTALRYNLTSREICLVERVELLWYRKKETTTNDNADVLWHTIYLLSFWPNK